MDRLLSIRLITRSSIAHNVVTKQQIRFSSDKNDSSSSDSSDSDNEQVKQNKKTTTINARKDEAKKETAALLNNLLSKMNQEKLVTKTVNFAVPAKKSFSKKEKVLTLEENIEVAAKKVAATLGGDVEQKEKDLLGKVFSAGTPAPGLSNEEIKDKPSKSLTELLSGMKVDKTRKPVAPVEGMPYSRSAKIQELAKKFQNIRPRERTEQGHTPTAREKLQPVNLCNGRGLEIFDKNMKTSAETVTLSTWEALQEKELKMLMTHPPENVFQEMIQWTERGLLWKFPIDNEQGLEAEQSVHFSEHVFLERHLKGWCPTKGPIRHFMELVCVGLSKNPYMTVEEKKDHIFWFREYFGLTQGLLKELNCIQEDIPVEIQSIYSKDLFKIIYFIFSILCLSRG